MSKTALKDVNTISPEEKVRAHFTVVSSEEGTREFVEQLIHKDIVVNDPPVGLRAEGLEAVWPT